MNKFIAITIVLATVLTAFMCFELTASAGDSAPKADWVLGDFSVAGGADNWKGTGSTQHKDNMQSDITRIGKSYALKWDTNQGGSAKNKRVQSQSSAFSNWKGWKYINVWLYSENGNGQVVNFYLNCNNINWPNAEASTSPHKETVNWTGWKLVSIPLGDTMTNAYFKDCTDSQNMYFQMQTDGFGTSNLTNTVLYVDSIWMSMKDPTVMTDLPAEEITSDIKNNMRDISPSTKSFNITSNKLMKVTNSAYNDKIEVYKGNVLQTLGTDYVIQSESNKLSVKFKNELELDASYKVILKAGAPFDDGTETTKDYSVTFTVNQVEFDIKSTGFTFVPASLPASGEIIVSLPVTNLTGSAQTGILYVGVYDKTTNQMIALGQSTDPLAVAGNSTGKFTATVSAASYANCYVRAFLWNNLNDMYSFGNYGELK